jgi:hypothetical protein
LPVAGVSSRWTFGTKDSLDLVETAHLTFKGAADGEIAFGALKGFLDVRYGTRDGSACAEFSWEGNENDPTSGRGWVVLGTAGRLVGHFYIHNGEDSASYAIVPDFFNGLLGQMLKTVGADPKNEIMILTGSGGEFMMDPSSRHASRSTASCHGNRLRYCARHWPVARPIRPVA